MSTRYTRAHAHQVLFFMRNEYRLFGEAVVGDFKGLHYNDFRNEFAFFLQKGPIRTGFISVRFGASSVMRELAKIYVSPPHRNQGIATFALQRLKVGRANIPTRMHGLIRLCLHLGFQYSPQQRYPETMAELIRPLGGDRQ